MKTIPKKVLEQIHNIERIHYYNNIAIIDTKEDKLLYRTALSKDITNYFDKIGFEDYPKKINTENEYDLCQLPFTDKEKNKILKDLYLKSLEEIDYTDDQQETIYHHLVNEYDNTFQYYLKKQDWLEEQLYFQKEEYILLINISQIYHLLSIGRFFLEKWNNQKESTYKNIFWIKNISNHSFINGKLVEISDNLEKDNLIYALANYYRAFFLEEDIFQNLEKIMKELSIKDYERYLFYSLISLPLNKNHINEKEIYENINYTKKTYNYLLKEYEKNQKSEE